MHTYTPFINQGIITLEKNEIFRGFLFCFWKL